MARVLWLRAHARHTRLQEEVVLLLTEMEKTCATFGHDKDQWRKREQREQSEFSGWAARQATLWESLRVHAATEFDQVKQLHLPPEVDL